MINTTMITTKIMQLLVDAASASSTHCTSEYTVALG